MNGPLLLFQNEIRFTWWCEAFVMMLKRKKSKQFVFWDREGGREGRGGGVQRLLHHHICLKVINGTLGAIFFLQVPMISWQNCFHGVWWLWAAATAVDEVFRKVLSSLLLKNPWHGERRSTCKATYCTYFTYDDHWQQKALCERYVNEPTIVRKARLHWVEIFKSYLWVSMSTIYKWELVQICSFVWECHCLHSALGWLFKSQFACCVLRNIPFFSHLGQKIKENTPNLQSKVDIHKVCLVTLNLFTILYFTMG
jgi:hypothetical protein